MTLERGQVLKMVRRPEDRGNLIRILMLHPLDPSKDPTEGPAQAEEMAYAEAEVYRPSMKPLGPVGKELPVWKLLIEEPHKNLRPVSARELIAWI